MSTAGHDDVRAAAALLAIAASGADPDELAHRLIFGGGTTPFYSNQDRFCRCASTPTNSDQDRSAAIACILAGWLAEVLRETGTDPRDFARQVIAESIADEATEAAS